MHARNSAAFVDPRTQGLRDTRWALKRWDADPGPVLGPWFGLSLVVGIALLAAVWLVSLFAQVDPTSVSLGGLFAEPNPAEYARILGSNLIVLALHATACVAGFIAGSSLRHGSVQRSGLSRFVHQKAGRIAIAWVVFVIAYSLVTQALVLGADGAALAGQLGISSLLLIVTTLPHALLELTAIFLPLAAWMIARRHEQWNDLLAATLVTVALAVPMLVAAAMIELYVWPDLLLAAAPNLP